ncbi:hypothetical protein HDU91_001257 [Kappamyces sp. JEL0680]|nr:hypothetical protein HDU91_001257 [Kappamyces sp. JEL0680]
MPSKEAQTAKVMIPDVLVSDGVPPTADFSMVAGDFIEVYGEEHQTGAWDCIVTCFFIDTNKNFLDYLRVIQKALKAGGAWINLGPLLYHFEGSEDAVEFTLEEITELIARYGFSIEKQATIETVYSACPQTMMHYLYRNSYFMALKK